MPKSPSLARQLSGGTSDITGDSSIGGDSQHIHMVSSIVSAVAPCARLRVISSGPVSERITDALALQTFITINLSFMGAIKDPDYKPSSLWGDNDTSLKLTDLLGNNKVLLIAAAGNENKSLTYYEDGANSSSIMASHLAELPKDKYSDLIFVGSVDNETNKKADLSNYPGEAVLVQNNFICAPGQDYWVMGVNDQYKFERGTSFAAPTLTGCVNLIQQLRPDLPSIVIKEIILSTAKQTFRISEPGGGLKFWVYKNDGEASTIPSDERGTAKRFADVAHTYGRGILDMEAAINLARTYLRA